MKKEVKFLIHLIQEHPYLYDTSNKDYYNKIKRRNVLVSLKIIIEELTKKILLRL